MIKEITNPKLKDPVFIAVWPGMGEVSYRCGLFLREVMGFKLFAKLEARDFFKPAAVTVDAGVVSLPTTPAGFFYYLKGRKFPDIILFLGEAQPPLEYAEELSSAVVDFVKKHKAKFLMTFAAKPEGIDHKANPAVWLAATGADIIGRFAKFGLKIFKEGQISGLNGIILGVAKRKRLKGVCLLAEIPFYTVQIENPKATTNILSVVKDYLNINLNLGPLRERSVFIDEEIDKLISYLKGEGQSSGPLPLNEEDINKIKKDLAAYTKLPQSAIQEIEKSFQDAQKDITQASRLKAELDRWNVYKEYEDRFLDLFKKKERGKKDQQQ